MTNNEALAKLVGRLCDNQNKLIASCFPVSDMDIVTCYHAIKSYDFSTTVFTIEWPRYNLIRTATISLDEVSEDMDIAFLHLNEKLPDTFTLYKLGFKYQTNGDFKSFGYRKSNYYNGLYANGKMLGEIDTISNRPLIQLQSTNIENGMSGAPVLDETYGRIVGMVSEYWATKSQIDNNLAFAVPVSSMLTIKQTLTNTIPDLVAVPKDIKSGMPLKPLNKEEILDDISSEDYVKACTKLAVLVAADQLPDGAWGRSLWKETGVKYTTDVANKDDVKKTHIKKALSATSWAAQALAKTMGTNNLYPIKVATEFAHLHRDNLTGGFGNIYVINSGTPLVNTTTVIRSPRHTASGIKLLEMSQGMSRPVIKGFEFIVKNECEGGGWGEAIGDAPNTLSTAYVLDALIKMMQIPKFREMLTPRVRSIAKPSINRGMTWLIQARDESDGLWRYANSSEYKPLYSSHVLGFVPQLVTSYREETLESMDSLLSLEVNGGIPATKNGDADFTTTSLCLYAMLRIAPDKYKNKIHQYVKWLIQKVLSDEWTANYSGLEGIMGLIALTQVPNIPKYSIYASLSPILGDNLIEERGLSDDPTLWLEIDKLYDLGLENIIKEMYFV